jgi:sulfur-carrier protein
VPGETVRAVVAGLDAEAPGIRDRLLSGGAIREHLKIFVDGDLATLDTPLGPRSLVQVVLAVSGG